MTNSISANSTVSMFNSASILSSSAQKNGLAGNVVIKNVSASNAVFEKKEIENLLFTHLSENKSEAAIFRELLVKKLTLQAKVQTPETITGNATHKTLDSSNFFDNPSLAFEQPATPDNSVHLPSTVPSTVPSTAWFFAGTQARYVPNEGTWQDKELWQQYGRWHEQELHRERRRFRDGQVSIAQVMDLRAHEVDSRILPDALNNLKQLLQTKMGDHYNNCKLITAEIDDLMEKSPLLRSFLSDSLDLIQSTFIENSPALKDAYTLYMSRTEQSLREKGKYYAHSDAESFFFAPSQGSRDLFQDMTVSDFEVKEARVLATILYKQAQGIDLDFQQLGLVFAHLDTAYYSTAISALRPRWNAALVEWQEDVFTRYSAEHKAFISYLKKKRFPPSLAQPIQFSQPAYLAKYIGHTSRNEGFCQYFATDVLFALENKDAKGLESVNNMVRRIKDVAMNDPIYAYRFFNGLVETSYQLQETKLNIPNRPDIKTETDLRTTLRSFSTLAGTVSDGSTAYRIDIRYLDAQRKTTSAHVISAAKIKISRTKAVTLIVDANWGIIPCYTPSQVKKALEKTLKNLSSPLGAGETIEYSVTPMTRKNMKILKKIRPKCGIGYGLLASNGDIDQFKRVPLAAMHTDWNHYFPKLNVGKAPVATFVAPEAHLKQSPYMTLDAFDEAVEKGFFDASTGSPLTEADLATENIVEAVKQQKLSFKQRLDAAVRARDQQSGRFTLGLFRRRQLNAMASDFTKMEKMLPVALPKVSDTAQTVTTSGKVLFSTLVNAAAELEGSGSVISKVRLDNAVGTSTQKHYSVETTVSSAGITSSIIERLGLNEDALAQLVVNKNIHMKDFDQQKLRSFLHAELNKISIAEVEAIELTNSKIKQQLENLDQQALNNKIQSKLRAKIAGDGTADTDYEVSLTKTDDAKGEIVLVHKKTQKEVRISAVGDAILGEFKSIRNQVKQKLNRAYLSASTINVSPKAKRAWKGFGRASGVGGGIMAIYSAVDLGKQLKHIQSLDKATQAMFYINVVDSTVDNVSNAIGTVNWLFKKAGLARGVLPTVTKYAGRGAAVIGLICNLVEVGYHSYTLHNAETAFEKKMAGTYLGFAIAETALSIAALAVCAAFPAAAPLFMIVGLLMALTKWLVASHYINQESADKAFEEYENELKFLQKLFNDPEIVFEQQGEILSVSTKVGHDRIEVTENEIKMFRNHYPFGLEFINTYLAKVNEFAKKRVAAIKYAGNSVNDIFVPFKSAAGSNIFAPIQSLSDATIANANYLDMLKLLSPNGTFVMGSTRKKLHEEIRQNRKTYHINQLNSKAFPERIEKALSSQTRHIIFPGKPKSVSHFVSRCEKEQTGGYQPAQHKIPLVTALEKQIKEGSSCYDTSLWWLSASGLSLRPQSCWQKKRWQHVLNKSFLEANAVKLEYFKGRDFSFREIDASTTQAVKKADGSYEFIPRLPAPKPARGYTYCWEKPDRINLDFRDPQYELSAQGMSGALFYHFLPDRTQQALLEGRQIYYALNETVNAYPVAWHNASKNNLAYKIALTSTDDYHFMLSNGTELNIKTSYPVRRTQSSVINLYYPHDALLSERSENKPVVSATWNNVKKMVLGSSEALAASAIVSFDQSMNDSIRLHLSTNMDKVSRQTESVFTLGVTFRQNLNGQFTLLNIANLPIEQSMQDTLDTLRANLEKLSEPFEDIDYGQGVPISQLQFNNYFPHLASKFEGSGWLFVKGKSQAIDNVLAGFSSYEKNGMTVIAKIWHKNAPKDLKDTFRRMGFVGFTLTKYEDLPAYLQQDPLIWEGDELVTHYFYDQVEDKLVRQFALNPIEHSQLGNVVNCPKGASAHKVFWQQRNANGQIANTEIFSCDAITILPPNERIGISSGRVQIGLSIDRSLEEFKQEKSKNHHDTRHLFEWITAKATARVRSFWGIDNESETEEASALPHLFIEVDNVNVTSTKKGEAKKVKFIITNDDAKIKVDTIPQGESIIAVPKGQSYVLTSKELTQEATSENLPLQAIIVRQSTQGENLLKLQQELMMSGAISSFSLPAEKVLLPKLDIVNIQNLPEEKRFICTSAEGVSFSLSHDLEDTSLQAVSNGYLANKCSNETLSANQVLGIYTELCLNYGQPNYEYFLLSEGKYNTSALAPTSLCQTQNSPFVFVTKASNRAIFVPPHFTQQGKERALSSHINIVCEKSANGHEHNGNEVTVQDYRQKMLFTVHNSQTQNSSIVNAFNYDFLDKIKDAIFLAMPAIDTDAIDTDASKTAPPVLPYLDVSNLAVLPCYASQNRVVQTLRIDPVMQQQLQRITLAAPPNKWYQAQPIELTGTKGEVKVLIQNNGNVSRELFLFLPVVQNIEGINIISEPIMVRLENAFCASEASNDFQLNHAFDNCIIVNGEMLNIAKLVKEAEIIDVSEFAEEEDSYERGLDSDEKGLDSYMDGEEETPAVRFS